MRDIPELDQLCDLVNRRATDDLERLGVSMEIARRLSDVSDELVGYYVDEARAGGASWADVGDCLGVTRQAAQKRFVFSDQPGGRRRDRMFARFSAPARALVRDAVALAQDAGSDHVGTEHILLAMINDEKGEARAAIVGLGSWSGDRIASTIQDQLADAGATRHRGHIPFAGDAKKLLHLSLRETLRAGKRQIDEPQILIAMLRDQRSPAALALAEEGITRQRVEEWLENRAA
jgi:hypothetical protein